MNDLSQSALLQSLVKLSAMAFGAMPPADALQSFADALGVQTVAICRVDHFTQETKVLAQNTLANDDTAGRMTLAAASNSDKVVLSDTTDVHDILIIRTGHNALQTEQRNALQGQNDFLQTLWSSRTDTFERALSKGASSAAQNTLRPDNLLKLPRDRDAGLFARRDGPPSGHHFAMDENLLVHGAYASA